MCGRFTQAYTWAEVYEAYRLIGAAQNLQPHYNISPTQEIDIMVANDSGEHELLRARWGLVPGWWKKELRDLPSTFNARAETVAEKPMFRAAFKSRRCIVPASGFFEWTGPKGKKQPWYMTASDGSLLSFAGLWERWREPESGEDVVSATIIVCAANEFIQRLHHRMPAILTGETYVNWLTAPDSDLLLPAPEGTLIAWPVDPKVNSSRYESAEAIAATGETIS